MKKISSMLCCALFSGALISGCKEEKTAPPPMVPDVNVVNAGRQTVAVYSDYVGQTYGISDVNIRSRISGYVVSMHFKEGQTVQKGQLLYVVDDRNIQARIDASEAQVAEAGLRNAKIDLSFSRITSPITGIIGISKVLVGDFVTQGAMGEPINTVSAVGEIRVRFPISEAEYLRFAKRGREVGAEKNKITEIPVELVLGDNSVFNETGKIDLANRQIDPETGSLTLQAVFQNKEKLLRPGQYVKVRFKTDEYKDALMIPQGAVNQLQGIYQVFVVNDSNKLAPKVVIPGARVGSNWIIQSGLQEGEKVAIIGSAAINPKLPVKPVPINWNYDSTSRNQ